MFARAIQEEQRLRNCPNCGGEGEIRYEERASIHYAICKECHSHTMGCCNVLGAADDWNSGAVLPADSMRRK